MSRMLCPMTPLAACLLQEVLSEGLERRLLWAVVGVDGASSSHSRDATFLGLLVDDAHERVDDQVVAQLTSNPVKIIKCSACLTGPNLNQS